MDANTAIDTSTDYIDSTTVMTNDSDDEDDGRMRISPNDCRRQPFRNFYLMHPC